MDELITVLSNRRISYNVSNRMVIRIYIWDEKIRLAYRAFYRSISWDEIQKFSYREHAVCKFYRIYQFCCLKIETWNLNKKKKKEKKKIDFPSTDLFRVLILENATIYKYCSIISRKEIN